MTFLNMSLKKKVADRQLGKKLHRNGYKFFYEKIYETQRSCSQKLSWRREAINKQLTTGNSVLLVQDKFFWGKIYETQRSCSQNILFQ